MKKFCLILTLIVSIFILFSFSACGYKTVDLTYFNTGVYIATDKDAEKVKQQIKDDLSLIENLLSITKEDSEISKINRLQVGNNLPISPTTKEVFDISKQAFSFTDGAFNPAVYPILKLFKLSADTFDPNLISITPPTTLEIENVKPFTDFSKINLNDGNIYKEFSDVQIDLGGIAKGYAVDKIKTHLEGLDTTSGYISVGGSSIYVFSTKEDLAIKHPNKSQNIISVDSSFIENSPLSTSGDYQKYYTDFNDKSIRYSHIIDMDTCLPITSGMRSVTVIANGNLSNELKSASFTDAISTALCTMDKQSLIEFTKTKLSGFTVFAIYEKDGVKEIISNCPSNLFEILDTEYQAVSI